MRKLFTGLVSAAILGTALVGISFPARAGSTALQPIRDQLERAYPNESYAQYYYRRPYHHYRHHHHRHYYRGGGGDALAAGAVGLAAGALIGAAIASQAQAAPPPPPGTVDPSVAAYCARKYRSYDPVTGTFMASNGMRYVCTYP